MEIRSFRPEDKPELERIHRAQGFAYPMVDLDDPLYFLKIVGEEGGQIVSAAIGHLTAEVFLLADPNAGTPRQRFENFKAIEDLGCKVAYVKGGLNEIFCWLPPQIEKRFGKRLMRLGWRKPLWPSFAKDLRG